MKADPISSQAPKIIDHIAQRKRNGLGSDEEDAETNLMNFELKLPRKATTRTANDTKVALKSRRKTEKDAMQGMSDDDDEDDEDDDNENYENEEGIGKGEEGVGEEQNSVDDRGLRTAKGGMFTYHLRYTFL